EPSVELVVYLAGRSPATATEIADAAKQLVARAGGATVLTVDAARSMSGAVGSAGTETPAQTVVTSRVQAIALEDGGFFLPRDKTIWDWPDVGGRLIEELR
ncbi:MAG: hypothetical protein ACR2G6_15055, partial [Gemmatimonadaceae bacterium]